MPPEQRFRHPWRPLASSHRVRRGDQPPLSQVVNILLALGDVDRRRRFCFEQLRQTIQNPRDAGEIPDPPAFAIWPALPEFLRLVSDGLENKGTGCVSIIVGRDDVSAGTRCVFGCRGLDCNVLL